MFLLWSCSRKFAAAQRVGVPVWRVQEALLAAERFTVALPLKAPLQAMVDRVRDLLVRIKEVVPNPATVGNSLCPCCAVGSWGCAPTFDSPLMPSTLVVRWLRQHSKGPAGTRLPQGVGLGLDRSGPQPQAGEDAPFTPAVPSSGAAGADGMLLRSALYPLRLFCCAKLRRLSFSSSAVVLFCR